MTYFRRNPNGVFASANLSAHRRRRLAALFLLAAVKVKRRRRWRRWRSGSPRSSPYEAARCVGPWAWSRALISKLKPIGRWRSRASKRPTARRLSGRLRPPSRARRCCRRRRRSAARRSCRGRRRPGGRAPRLAR